MIEKHNSNISAEQNGDKVNKLYFFLPNEMKIGECELFTWRLTAYKKPLKRINRGKMEKRKK